MATSVVSPPTSPFADRQSVPRAQDTYVEAMKQRYSMRYGKSVGLESPGPLDFSTGIKSPATPPLESPAPPDAVQVASPPLNSTRSPVRLSQQSAPSDALYAIAVIGAAGAIAEERRRAPLQASPGAQAAHESRNAHDKHIRAVASKVQIENAHVLRSQAPSKVAAIYHDGGLATGLAAGDEYRLYDAMRSTLPLDEDPPGHTSQYRLCPAAQRQLDHEGVILAASSS
eukprot:TRINITY_DN28241_c0_g1_i1.p1 TRINITY_DN28241_c0_g1~~TRINITY_DN28241_c0_g1_i1.p1  ORF type:complete len:244 (+),score=70.05 TRINITY_DN28241_c0_g1_i1:50-733(+)